MNCGRSNLADRIPRSQPYAMCFQRTLNEEFGDVKTFFFGPQGSFD